MKRRHFTAAVLAATLAAGLVSTPAYAVNDLRIIAPAKPGGGWDQTARALAEVMTAQGATGVSVENVPGAGGTVGLAQLVEQEKGKANVLMVNGLVMLGAILTNQSAVNLSMSTPIARLTGEYEVIVVPASSDVKTLADLAAKLKADTGTVAFGGGSAGGTDHILAGLVAKAAGGDVSKLNYVPFSGGGEALASVMGGQTTAGVSGLGEWAAQIESGDLVALALSGRADDGGGATPAASASSDLAASIPTLQEQGIDLELANWRGVVAPPDLSEESVANIIATFDALNASAGWQEALATNGWTNLYQSGDAFATYLDEQIATINQTLQDLGLI
jgi:putative tricarboxylic transport membrane protein